MLDWITGFVKQSGYLAIALLMFAENLFPPIPSELIMPLAGFAAARGDLNVFLAIMSGAAGSLLGAVFWYYLARSVGSDRLQGWAAKYGRRLTLTSEEVEYACAWFNRHGGKAVFVGRLIPAVRTLISIPAGFARMPLVRFLIASALGTVIWTSTLAAAGYLLEAQYRKVADWMNPLVNVIIGLLILAYLYRVATFRDAPRP